ncbi:AAA family ATPase [Paralimibaculum aggregatum]|uniref:AAA family ATPase n=1 Tax=Paralimibaculum aggregatum TaxID=3036245 RepID=A0ABQ6LDI4_9RHOB|nr:AAA family ATPase [Limibaculum sp. NKW23]GMG81420.1 AAA family ATPase [Limibaculum sp. NKW23]
MLHHRFTAPRRAAAPAAEGAPGAATDLLGRADAAQKAAALPPLSEEQADAWDRISELLAGQGIDLVAGTAAPRSEKKQPSEVIAVSGKAGSGKTVLLAGLGAALSEAGLAVVTPDWESRRKGRGRSYAVLAPTNKAASVLRGKGVAATTLHRILYTPVYDPEFEKIAEWLEDARKARPETDVLAPEALDRARAAFDEHGSVPGALAAAGVRGADFITGWTRREEPLDIALVDEASMLEPRQLDDLREIFGLIVLFGDPAQLPPVRGAAKGAKADEGMVFEQLPAPRICRLARVHRQAGDNPIIELAHRLGEPDLGFEDFEAAVERAAAEDPRVEVAQRADADLMRESPVLVWRNKTRVRLIGAFRGAHGCPEAALLPGEPLICDGLELPLKQRKRRVELESRGLIKGAQARYLGPGSRPGFARVDVAGTDEGGISVAAIIQVEHPDETEPRLLSAARMGALFVHGAACTIHKAQGSQWPAVQVFAPDLFAAARAGAVEAGVHLWKRLAYVAITRAEDRLLWVTRYRISRPAAPLSEAAQG